MSTPGTWNVATGEPVGWSDAVNAWKDAARPVLVGVAGVYGSYITYGELAERVQAETGISTKVLISNWIGEVLGAVDLAQPAEEPLLSSLVVHVEGTVGNGYAEPVKRREGAVPDDLQWHAAQQRLRCYQHFGAVLPADGGRPQLTAQIAVARGRAARSAPPPTCPTCHLQLPASGTCNICG